MGAPRAVNGRRLSKAAHSGERPDTFGCGGARARACKGRRKLGGESICAFGPLAPWPPQRAHPCIRGRACPAGMRAAFGPQVGGLLCACHRRRQFGCVCCGEFWEALLSRWVGRSCPHLPLRRFGRRLGGCHVHGKLVGGCRVVKREAISGTTSQTGRLAGAMSRGTWQLAAPLSYLGRWVKGEWSLSALRSARASEDPLNKVVALLDQLEAKIQQEGEAEAKSFKDSAAFRPECVWALGLLHERCATCGWYIGHAPSGVGSPGWCCEEVLSQNGYGRIPRVTTSCASGATLIT